MKQPENNEIDTLLRSWASNERSRSAQPSQNVAGSHLDADELSSYTEGVLPVAARARYTAHLIDCDECRRLIAELTEAKPLPAGDQVVGDVNRSWRARLAAFFAPSVLKYAVPSLAVLVIAVVFIATRKPEQDKSVALSTASPVSSPSASSGFITSENGVSPQRNTAGETSKTVAQPSRSPQGQSSPETDDRRTRADVADKEDQSKQNAVAATNTATEASRKAEAEAKEKRPEPANETVVVAPPPAAPAPASAAKVAGRAPKDADAAARDEVTVSGERGGPSKGVANSKNARIAGQDKTEVRSLGSLQAAGTNNDQQRTVAGRKFKREDGKWIDAGYKSSMAVTTVSRGSEQFRALVADEPEIEAISKQLSGEVIVVWKGRAYRIN